MVLVKVMFLKSSFNEIKTPCKELLIVMLSRRTVKVPKKGTKVPVLETGFELLFLLLSKIVHSYGFLTVGHMLHVRK